MKVAINNKEIDFKEFFNVLNDIWLIVSGNCAKCNREGLGDKEKLELIKDIMVKRLNFKG